MKSETTLPSPAAHSEPNGRVCRGTVMVVDDEEQNRTLLRDPLEANGYEVIEVDNGIRALQEVEQRTPDVVLLDLMMPKMDGFEVCRRLKKYWKSAHVPVLILTALSDRKERLMGVQAGANDFLVKPVDLQDVILRVGNAVHAKSLHDQLQAEREKSERLLQNILPKAIAERMKNGELNIADHHPDATLLVADLVGFAALASSIDPAEVVNLLNEVFSAFDVLTGKRDLEKIKTMGDAYMAAGGIRSHEHDHADAIVGLSRELQYEIARINEQYNTSIRIRIGINTGPVIAGVIGRNAFAYDVWGDTVNVACRMESTGQPGRIQVAESTYERLKDKRRFEEKHTVEVKGQTLTAYWLVA